MRICINKLSSTNKLMASNYLLQLLPSNLKNMHCPNDLS